MADENYFILLELDPSTKDWDKIEAAINKKRADWSREKTQGTGVRRAQADQHLKNIAEMEKLLRKPSKRQEHAEEAREILKKREAEKRKKLDELIAVIPAGGTIYEKDVIALAKLAGGLTESDVSEWLKTRNISVVEARKPDGAPKRRPKLDPTTTNRIKKCLVRLGHKDLYRFLGFSPLNSQLEDLSRAAAKEYKRLEDGGKSDPETDVRRELAGLAKAVFKDADTKERYDNSRAVERMVDLQGQLVFAGRDRILDDFAIRQLLTQATKMGVRRDLALEYIEEHAQKQKWVVLSGTQGPADELMVCGNCNSTARSKDAKKCHECGKDLIQACPRCGTPTPTQDKCCGHCGCSTGARIIVEPLFHKAEGLLKKAELDAADACFEEALEYWPGWKKAEAGKKRVAERRREKKAALDAVDALVRGRKLEAAQSALDGLKREFVSGGTRDLAPRIKQGLAKARSAFDEGQSLRREGKDEAAVERFMAALDSCVDFDAAKSALASIPPAPVRALKVTLNGSTARLKWTSPTAGRQVKYRVLRKVGGAPNGPNDGEQVAEVAGASCEDRRIHPGVALYYAVFAVRGPAASSGVSRGPYLRRADVSGEKTEPGDGQVILRWTPPAGCASVEVWRARGEAPRAGQGTRVKVSGNSVVDQGLENGVCFGSRVVACYRDPEGGQELLRAPGVELSATPTVPPAAVEDLRAHREGRVVTLEWSAPGGAIVELWQSEREPKFGAGRSISRSDAGKLGTPVSIKSSGRTQTTLNTQGRVFFIPVSVVRETAVVGKAAEVTAIEDVAALEAQRDGDRITLSWDWPRGAERVKISWGHEDYPWEAKGTAAGFEVITHAEYRRQGNWTLANAAPKHHYFTVFVHDPEADIYSTGVRVFAGQVALVRYRVVVKRHLFFRAVQEQWIELKTTDEIRNLKDVIVVLSDSGPAMSPEHGRVMPGVGGNIHFKDGAARIPLPLDGAAGYIKLFFSNEERACEARLLPAGKEQLRFG